MISDKQRLNASDRLRDGRHMTSRSLAIALRRPRTVQTPGGTPVPNRVSIYHGASRAGDGSSL